METAKAGAPRLQINDRLLTLQPRETVLQAAERQGLALPSSCRVGGCGTCKCRLVSGRVSERTETGYLLTAEELAAGYILACQSVPQSDVRIAIELPPERGRVAGRIVEQARVTHDICRLTVKLDQPLDYRAGQFANVELDGLPGVARSYSFASPAAPDGVVRFFVRRVPGGVLSAALNDQELLGRPLYLDGPHGDFWLRPGDAPLLLVAGGSGLAPILALLHDAANQALQRPVTLVFGAREARDLYALDEIEALARRWRGPFRFLPVLSNVSAESDWSGARGLVTDVLAELIPPDAHAYVCGPPAMIEGAVTLLRERGLPQGQIHVDRFTTRADAPLQAAAVERASPLHYLKFFMFHAIGLCALASLLAGGRTITAGLVAVLTAYILGDALAGDDTSTPQFTRTAILTTQLWLALPLLTLIVFACVWSVAPGDPLGFGALVGRWSGYDLLAARAATGLGHHVAACVLTGLMIGMVGTITGHELTHRTWDPISMLIGRWLLAFSFDTSFAVEHVYGHHRYVATSADPATAPRGRSVYAHVLLSTVRGNLSAWHIEGERLRKRRRARWSWHNAVLRGYAMSAGLLAAAYALGGWRAAAALVVCGLWGKSLLEIVNYMEHYGMVRHPQTPVQFRHSWNTNRRVSSWAMFNLTRHSHHHAQGEVPYHALRPYPGAPMMLNGYLTTILIALIPPLWHRLMTPKVLAWDRDFADDDERALAAQANAQAGWRRPR